MTKIKLSIVLGALVGAAAAAALAATDPARGSDAEKKSIERGRYLIKITGCNDCHTPKYAETGGKVAESQWLTGDSLGWSGPWGTTYASNLRLFMGNVTEQQWLQLARTMQYRPPMPWFALRDMSEEDLRAIYRFVRHLGPAGQPAPKYLAPGQKPNGPVVQFPVKH